MDLFSEDIEFEVYRIEIEWQAFRKTQQITIAGFIPVFLESLKNRWEEAHW